MKIIKGFVLFCFLSLGISACFNPPEFSNKPEIIFREVYFQKSADPDIQDSIVLRFDFKDGDGDLGLPLTSLENPYHQTNFFVEGTAPEITAIPSFLTSDFSFLFPSGVILASTGEAPTGVLYYVESIPTGKKLVTFNSRKHGFNTLPPFSAPYSTCSAGLQSYNRNTFFIPAANKSAVRKSSIVDSLLANTASSTKPVLAYAVSDTVYNEVNLNQYTILVRFYQKVGNNFQEFDWRKEFCSTYDNKFTVLSDRSSPLEGTITFSMKSFGFLNVFSVRPLYLEFQIIDRALNRSNIERTREFTLVE